MAKWVVGVVLAISMLGLCSANGQQERGEPRPARGLSGESGERVMGTIASVGVDRFTVRTLNGKEQTIIVSDQTSYREGEKGLQLEDLKPGDRIFIRGCTGTGNQMSALIVRRITDAEMQRFGGWGDRAFGEIVAVGKNEMTMRNRMQGERVVEINDQTTFMRDGKPSTSADLKVGDRVMAVGKESNGTFTATRVMSGLVGSGRWGGRRGTPEASPPTQ